MRAHHVRGAISVIAAVALLAACGDDETASGASADDTVPAASTSSAASTASTLPSTTVVDAVAATTAVPSDEECPSERTMLEVATEAYYAQNGAFPQSETELVEAQYIRDEAAAYDLLPDTGEVVRVAGVPCPAEPEQPDTADSSDAEPLTVDRVLAELGEDGVAMIGGEECAREFAEIALAGERFIAREGRDPESLEELADDLEVELSLWAVDAELETLVPAEGSPCVDVFSGAGDDALAEGCDESRDTLEVAREAYFAQLGPGAPEPTEADLVEQRLIRDEDPALDLVDGVVVAVPGGLCDGVLTPAPSVP